MIGRLQDWLRRGYESMFDPPKDPFNVPGFVVALVAVWGATVSYLTRTKFMGVPVKLLVFCFIKELAICTFAAFLIHALCMLYGVTGWANVFLVAVGAHMGTEAIRLSEGILRGQFSMKGSPRRRKDDKPY